MFCQKCGKENPDNAAFCNSCGSGLIPHQEPAAASTTAIPKHNEIIKAKIRTREDQRKWYWVGPLVLFLIGGLFLFYLWPIALIIIVIAIWWDSARHKEANRLENEIKELELELK